MTARKGLVPYSRPLLEMVPRSQPFVYNGPDHLALPSPIPAQHPPALEQLLLQLLKEKKTRIRVRLCTPTRDPRTRLPQTPLILSRERKTLREAWGSKSAAPRITVRGRLIFPPGGPIAELGGSHVEPHFRSDLRFGQEQKAPPPAPADQSLLGGRLQAYINELRASTGLSKDRFRVSLFRLWVFGCRWRLGLTL